MQTSRSSPNPALTRGLKLLEEVMRTNGPARFSDLREVLPGISDSTLARLIHSLEETEYITAVGRSGYTAGPALRGLLAASNQRDASADESIQRTVRELSRRTNESAAFAQLENDHISILFSHGVAGAVSVIRTGGLLHFEPDHAAALAILQALPSRQRSQLLINRYSRIPSPEAFSRSLKACSRPGGYFMDSSRERPGICRMAVPVNSGKLSGALFLCLTEAHARAAEGDLSTAIMEHRDQILSLLS